MIPLLTPQQVQPSIAPDEMAEIYRRKISQGFHIGHRKALGQYLTPLPIARFMASLFDDAPEQVLLLDPGAGAGALTGAFVYEMAERTRKPKQIRAYCVEIDAGITSYLDATLTTCKLYGREKGIDFSGTIIQTDFIHWATNHLRSRGSLFELPLPQFTHCIMNPPYKKIRSDSAYRKRLKEIGIETSNLYTGFLALAIQLLSPGGELVAIVPRSFCNGPYFRPFRRFLLRNVAIRHIHVFESRDKAFADDDVLQENIILHVLKGASQGKVLISLSQGPDFEECTQREVSFDEIVKPNDPDAMIHIATNELEQMVVDRLSVFAHTLDDLGIDVSTGPIVEFRQRDNIRKNPSEYTFPLIYPAHFENGFVKWPDIRGRKPNAILEDDENRRLLFENGWYVLTRRFSSKEERRRIIAVLHTPERVPGEKVGFENHLNVFHRQKEGLPPSLAKGLAVYLNATLVDRYFRLFSGHTQVNATDLRALHYPDTETLIHLGSLVSGHFPSQEEIDQRLDEVIDAMSDLDTRNPLPIHRRIQEALSILKALGLPKGQQNERSALTLLALIGLRPEMPWEDAQAPLMGITPIMEFISEHYGKQYAPNTREAIRRQTMHQFVEAGIAVPNPDDPGRPINSPKWCYQITPETLDLLHTFGTPRWKDTLQSYLQQRPKLAEQYAHQREMHMIPLQIGQDQEVLLSPGEHSQLIKAIVEQFGPRFAPGAQVLYIGDTRSKMLVFNETAFNELGLSPDKHGKFPDVILYMPAKNWLFLIEAVTSHGPMNAKRHEELINLFADAKAALIFVTAFPDRRLLARHLAEISWETEVWIAESPSHLIHFDGERFLGPYRSA